MTNLRQQNTHIILIDYIIIESDWMASRQTIIFLLGQGLQEKLYGNTVDFCRQLDWDKPVAFKSCELIALV